MEGAWFASLIGTLEQDAEAEQLEENTPTGIWEALKSRLTVAEVRPQTNPDVITSKLDGLQGPYYVLKNTRRKTYLRLSPQQYGLWERMDGHSSIQELIVEHFMETGNFAHNRVVHLYELLRSHHMLREAPIFAWGHLDEMIQRDSWYRRLSAPAQFFLTQRLSIKGIDHFVEGVYRFGGWIFFTRPAQVLFLLISMAGLVAFFQILDDPRYAFLGDNVLTGLVALWLAALLPVVIHEMGHALTVKHYGREVPNGGLMLYFGMPAAFMDTSDIWLEPRRARLAVTWNGPYTGLVLGGAASLLMFFYPAASINAFLFKMVGVAYATVFFNVNPLLKFDGYYLLSDALDISSLRERSLNFLRKGFVDKIQQRKSLTRDEWIFAIYGLLTIAWTAYFLKMASFFWQTRIRNGLQMLLGSGYPLIARLFGFLLVAALFSFIFLILLSLVRLGQRFVTQFAQSGSLSRHGRLALIGAAIALALGIGLPLAFPRYARLIAASLGFLGMLLGIQQLLLFNRPYRGSPRGLVHLAFLSAIGLGGLGQLAHLFPDPFQIAGWLDGIALTFSLAGGILLVWRPLSSMKRFPLVLGTLAGVLIVLALNWGGGIPLINPLLWILALLSTTGIWSFFRLTGSARAPAVVLLFLGGMVLSLSGFFPIPGIDLGSSGFLLMVAGAFHLVHARLPELSAYDREISSSAHQAIGSSVAILVRRVISQMYFESGWLGVVMLGREFTSEMSRNRLKLSISGNQFNDQELPQRSAMELTEVYGLAFNLLHRILCRDLGREMGTLTFGYGIDQLPWQNREVVSELILSRLDWGQTLSQELSETKKSRHTWLKRVPLFVTLEDGDLDAIASHLQEEHFAVGEVILRQGEAGDKFYIVERGQIAILKKGPEGDDVKVDEKGPGQYFGELALVSDRPRNATARADTPAVLLSLDQDDFDRLVRKTINLAEGLNTETRFSWLLRSMPIFDELESHELEWLATQMETETFGADEVVFHEGDAGDKFYIVETGQLVVTREVDGEVVELARRGPGEYVGEIALLQNRPRTATITTVQDTTLLSLEADYFLDLVASYLRLGEAVSRTSTRHMKFVQSVDPRVNRPAQIGNLEG